MRVVNSRKEGPGKIFELEGSIVSDDCWLSARESNPLAHEDDLEVLSAFRQVMGIYYIGTDGLFNDGKRFFVTLKGGYTWTEVEPLLRKMFESLPHVPQR